MLERFALLPYIDPMKCKNKPTVTAEKRRGMRAPFDGSSGGK